MSLIPKKPRASTHKADYKEQFKEAINDAIVDRIAELKIAIKMLSTIDEDFEKWYKQKFPDGE